MKTDKNPLPRGFTRLFLDSAAGACYTYKKRLPVHRPRARGRREIGERFMKRIQTINTRDLNKSAVTGGCGECQTSCQSACKTSCGVANQKCENKNK